ncbi:MAG TPA: DEAD/DEAH box helicase family protein, partial [Ktedonobacterales bacterium]|nr:DEAD/DEAH box helicase family protein [Ktedonobacterales bacterium]
MSLRYLQDTSDTRDISATAASDEDGSDGGDTLEDILAVLDGAHDEDDASEGGQGHEAENAAIVASLLPPIAARAPYALPVAPHLTVTPRPYQDEAVAAWLRADGRGIVVLPTGAGKTVVAFDAMARLGVRTLVVVPTIELLRQWRAGIQERLALPAEMVGAVGGGERNPGPITVITYDSAAMPRRKLNGYGLLVFDEAHHLPAQSYRAIAAKCAAPWRLGLSAT